MAPQARLKTPDLIDDLIANPKSFAYFQALRLLFLAHHDRFSSPTDLARRGLLVRASIQLGFPAADLIGVLPLQGQPSGQAEDGAVGAAPGPAHRDLLYDLTVTFMGLSGAASPLPPFYAQQIVEDAQEDDDSCKRLFDLISLPSYWNHAEAFFYNQLPFRLMAKNDNSSRDLLHSLMGQGHGGGVNERGQFVDDLAFLPLFATQSRTAHGLISYLEDRLGLRVLGLDQCVLRWVAIPPGQRLRLGGPDLESRALGAGAVVGRQARDLAGQFNLRLAVESPAELEALMPGSPFRSELEEAINLFLTSPLVYELELSLAPGVAKGTRLGSRETRGLGISSFLRPPPGQAMTVHSPAGGHRAPGLAPPAGRTP